MVTLSILLTQRTLLFQTTDTQLGNAFTDEVNDIERLPYQGKAGYEVKVVNSDSEDDDFYVKFIGTGGTPEDAVLDTPIHLNGLGKVLLRIHLVLMVKGIGQSG